MALAEQPIRETSGRRAGLLERRRIHDLQCNVAFELEIPRSVDGRLRTASDEFPDLEMTDGPANQSRSPHLARSGTILTCRGEHCTTVVGPESLKSSMHAAHGVCRSASGLGPVHAAATGFTYLVTGAAWARARRMETESAESRALPNPSWEVTCPSSSHHSTLGHPAIRSGIGSIASGAADRRMLTVVIGFPAASHCTSSGWTTICA